MGARVYSLALEDLEAPLPRHLAAGAFDFLKTAGNGASSTNGGTSSGFSFGNGSAASSTAAAKSTFSFGLASSSGPEAAAAPTSGFAFGGSASAGNSKEGTSVLGGTAAKPSSGFSF